MKYNQYKFVDIELGDGVYFDDVYSGKLLTQSNFDEYWDVTGKDEHNVMLKLHYIGRDYYWTVRYEDIRQIEKRNR